MRHRMIGVLALLMLLGALPAGAPTLAQTAPPTYYVPRQVIVSGLEEDLKTVVGGSGFNSLRQIGQIDLSYTANLTMPGFPFASRDRLFIQLYDTGNSDAALVVRSLNRRALALKLDVRAEANYVVGRDPALVQANPWSIGGSPWSIGGSSGGGGGLAAEGFLDQWAFGARGVSLFRGTGEKRERLVSFDGTGVPVAIFDTSPYSPPVDPVTKIGKSTETIDWISPTLKLDVVHPEALSNVIPQSPVDVSGHGVFIAGIIHAIAPESPIRLIRVLNRYGQGDLFSLCQAMHLFIKEQLAANRRAVLNLSLGVFPPPDAAAQGLPAELSALETAVLAAEGVGLAVVAAAGNQAAAVQQLPADYPTVIGIAGSTSLRGRSCFSNPGDLGAPGGNGSAPGCTPDLSGCDGPCGVAIISLSPTYDPLLGGGYLYWLGTSFAAPFASGAAALVLDQADGEISTEELRKRMELSATPSSLPAGDSSLGPGIISLTEALYPYSTSLPLVVR